MNPTIDLYVHDRKVCGYGYHFRVLIFFATKPCSRQQFLYERNVIAGRIKCHKPVVFLSFSLANRATSRCSWDVAHNPAWMNRPGRSLAARVTTKRVLNQASAFWSQFMGNEGTSCPLLQPHKTLDRQNKGLRMIIIKVCNFSLREWCLFFLRFNSLCHRSSFSPKKLVAPR